MDHSSALPITTRDLIRCGLQDLGAAMGNLVSLRNHGACDRCMHGLLESLERSCDPDVAVRNLTDIVAASSEGDHCLECGQEAMSRLMAVLGASDAMGKMMRSRPSLIRSVIDDPGGSWTSGRRREDALAAVGADPRDAVPVASLTIAQATAALRMAYYRQLASIMACDVLADDPTLIQPRISRSLSDLADATLEGALAIARHEVAGSPSCRFTVIGMGKLGAQELNYVSDVDVIYVVEPSSPGEQGGGLITIGTKMATTLQRVCQSVIPGVCEPSLWQIDTALRPEGKDGPLVRRLQSHQGYYRQWAESWEFQALLKARPVAGDVELGHAYMDMTRPFVWSASRRENFVYDCQQMRRRVEDLIAPELRDREIKLGRGGLRDVEFTVQMLQLVHGRSDHTLRTRSTLDSLRALSQGGYVSRVQSAKLAQDYRFERVLEHRQQMWSLKRTHLFPDLGKKGEGGLERQREISLEDMDRNADLRRLARAFRMHPEELVRRFDETRREVRRLHMDIYYRPMLPISARADSDAVELTPQAAQDRFTSIGFADPNSAMRHVKALTQGISRASRINRILLPAALQWLGQGQDPDMGLLHWRDLGERFGTDSEYLGFLRDSPSAAQRLCHVLSNSRFLADALSKSVESVTWMGNDSLLEKRDRTSLDAQCTAIIDRNGSDLNDCANSLRALRRHEIERAGLSWMSSVMKGDECLTAMTDVYDSIMEAAVRWSVRYETQRAGLGAPPARMAILAMGRYGGREVNFSSDADVIVIYDPTGADADDARTARFVRSAVNDIRTMLQGGTTLEPKIDIDFDLRPEGRNGPLARSLGSCREYYEKWSDTWEHQALIRARHAAGDETLSREFLTTVADPLRYPHEPPAETQVSGIRKLKARMEAERLPRGVRRERHLKLGRGGLSDVEWTIQLCQLRHAGRCPELRTESTLGALDAMEGLCLIEPEDAHALRTAWSMCTAARNGNYLWSGRAPRADILPDDLYSLGAIATYLGYGAHRGQGFENDLLSVMRRCREVVNRLFYDM
ncbi:MAG: bifunctional [glutamine synthetase] adenylyltransferase/[glutamine synthetase]-adenylyl-L-tyrosine phosphorylase [Bifidobacterium sp.]|jgi:glutamate-ammonia-ligase adenylyltransferase